jgi:hypothetical protein
MYGAVPYVMKAFGLDRNTAFAIVCEWLDRQQEITAVENNRVAAVRQKRQHRM